MILTLARLRAFVAYAAGTDADAYLQLLLDQAEAEIERVAGVSGPVTELCEGGYPGLVLSRPIVSITSVTEDPDGSPLILASDDHRFTVGGYVLHRLAGGTNPRGAWSGRVQVTYTPVSDTALREGVQLDLVRMDLAATPGVSSRTIGAWSESYGNSAASASRADILSRLVQGPGMVVL
jgi:hypothetical protein